MEDSEKVNITDFDDPQVVYDLMPYVRQYAKASERVIEVLCSGESVEIQDLQYVLRTLGTKIIPFFDDNHNLPADMQRLEDLISRIGGQL